MTSSRLSSTHILLRFPVRRVRAMRLADSLPGRLSNGINEWLEIGRLAVRHDRHVRRRYVELNIEVRVLRRLRDRATEPAAEHADVALVSRGVDAARHWRAVHAVGAQDRFLLRVVGPHL